MSGCDGLSSGRVFMSGSESRTGLTRVTNVGAKSNRSKDLHKVLAAHERKKKKKYLEACLEKHRHFSLFVVSTDGLLGKEAKILPKKPSLAGSPKSGRNPTPKFVDLSMQLWALPSSQPPISVSLRGSRIPMSKMCNRFRSRSTKQVSFFSDARVH